MVLNGRRATTRRAPSPSARRPSRSVSHSLFASLRCSFWRLAKLPDHLGRLHARRRVSSCNSLRTPNRSFAFYDFRCEINISMALNRETKSPDQPFGGPPQIVLSGLSRCSRTTKTCTVAITLSDWTQFCHMKTTALSHDSIFIIPT